MEAKVQFSVTDLKTGRVTSILKTLSLIEKDLESDELLEDAPENQADEQAGLLERIQQQLSQIFIAAITCSEHDEKWGFQFPYLKDDFGEEIKVEFKPENDLQSLFTIDKSSLYVSLEETTKEQVVSGELCPDQSKIDLLFTLSSKNLEKFQATLSVLIFSQALAEV